MSRSHRYMIDIGANLTDKMFSGMYHGKSYHAPDISTVLQRASQHGLGNVILTAGCAADVTECVRYVHEYSTSSLPLVTTLGVHPTRCLEFETYSSSPEAHIEHLLELYHKNKNHIVAVGECGLDYDRTHFCPREKQLLYFPRHFELTESLGLPMFLHDRNTDGDFLHLIRQNRDRFPHGVVHSFTGTQAEMESYVELDLFIGINGCSLKSEENLQVVSRIPLDRLVLETDAPYCDIRPTHAGHSFLTTHFDSMKKEKYDPAKLVKGRNEPCCLSQVAEVVAHLHNISVEDLIEQVFMNTYRLFPLLPEPKFGNDVDTLPT